MQYMKGKHAGAGRAAKWQADVLAQTTCMTRMGGGLAEAKKIGAQTERSVPEPLMPQGGVDETGEGRTRGERRATNRVEITVRVTSEDHHLGSKVLDREAKSIKFDKNGIITTNAAY